MAYHTREASFDIASINLHHTTDPYSPAPTYSSTFLPPRQRRHSNSSSPNKAGFTWKLFSWPSAEEDWAQTRTASLPHHNPATDMYPSSSRSKDIEMDAYSIKQDTHDPSHPHYIPPSSPEPHHHLPLRPQAQSRRSPYLRKRILIPWILALLFFLTTLWFTSIALGAKFLSILHPYPEGTVNVYVDGEALGGGAIRTSVELVPGSTPAVTATATASPSASSESAPSTTGDVLQTREPDAAPKPGNDPDNTGDRQGGTLRLERRRVGGVMVVPTAFVTVRRG